MSEETIIPEAPQQSPSPRRGHGDVLLALGGILGQVWTCWVYYSMRSDRGAPGWAFLTLACCCGFLLLPAACVFIPWRVVWSFTHPRLRLTWAGLALRALLFVTALSLIYGWLVIRPNLFDRCGDIGTREVFERSISREELQAWVVQVNERTPAEGYPDDFMPLTNQPDPDEPKGLRGIGRMRLPSFRRLPQAPGQARQVWVLEFETGGGWGHWGAEIGPPGWHAGDRAHTMRWRDGIYGMATD